MRAAPADIRPRFTTGRHICYNSKTLQDTAFISIMDLDVETLRARIEALKCEHRNLDEAIARLSETVPFDHVHLQRLKKRKLALKDHIIKLESDLLPDIIA